MTCSTEPNISAPAPAPPAKAMVNAGGVWFDLARDAAYVAPLHLLPVGTMAVPAGPVLMGPFVESHITLPDLGFIPRITVIGHDGQRRMTTPNDRTFPSGRNTDTPIHRVFDLTQPGALKGDFVTLNRALIAEWAHPLFMAGGVPDEGSVPFVCPACRQIHRHGAGSTSDGAELRETHCLSARAAGCTTAVLLPIGHPDPGSVLTRREAAWLRRWQRMEGWRADWPGQHPGMRLTRAQRQAQAARRTAVGLAS
jgi:hypothetical protein